MAGSDWPKKKKNFEIVPYANILAICTETLFMYVPTGFPTHARTRTLSSAPPALYKRRGELQIQDALLSSVCMRVRHPWVARINYMLFGILENVTCCCYMPDHLVVFMRDIILRSTFLRKGQVLYHT